MAVTTTRIPKVGFSEKTVFKLKPSKFSNINVIHSLLECFLYAEFLKKQNELQKAVRLLRVNCDDYNHGASCLEYGNIAFTGSQKNNVSPNYQEALKYFEKSCSLGNMAGCFNSGMMLVSPLLNSIGIPRDYAKVSHLPDMARIYYLP